MIRWMLILICFVVFAGLLFYLNKENEKTEKVRQANIPKTAKWIGGIDGGHWYHIVKEVSENTFHIHLYDDKTGESQLDTIFVLNQECTERRIDSLKLINSIDGFDGQRILLQISKDGTICYLTMK